MKHGLKSITDFFDTYNEAVLVIGNAFEPMYANAAFSRLTGFDLSNIKGTDFMGQIEQITAENGQQVKSNNKKGEQCYLNVSESPLRAEDSSLYRCFTFTKPRENPEDNFGNKFYELADASPAIIFIEDTAANPYYFNKSLLNFTGKQNCEDLKPVWNSLIHPKDIDAFNEIRTARAKMQSYSCEYRLQKFDGTYRSLFVIGTPIISNTGILNGYMNSGLDITEIKESQRKILQLSHELKQSNEELEQFTYVTSHDLQEPLRMITGYVQLIQKNIEKGNLGSINEFMAFVLDGTARMQLLITDLLQLSRVNRKALPFASVNAREVVNVALTHLAAQIKDSGAQIICGDLPVINGDTFQLVSLFENLIENAIKFRDKERLPHITISADEKEDKYVFCIKDNGIGIENKFHNRIFAIFQRLHTRAEFEGTGIGLAVCKKIVERHGGEIWVASEPGAGSTFYFSIKK